MAETLRERCERRLTGLKAVRLDLEDEWRNIGRFAQPSRTRFLMGSTSNAKKRRTWNNKLLDPHGIEAFRTLTNGMTSGLSSASRPWFSLTMRDEKIADGDGVRDWLGDVEKLMYAFLAKTNFYGAAKSGYAEMGLFGTEGCVMVEHRTVGAVCHALTAGEYWIALSDASVPDTLYRQCPMTVRQMVQSFEGSVSKSVKDMYDRGTYDEVVECFHGIEPNADHIPGKLGSKPWRSVYWESGQGKINGLLRESGYEEQPFWAPRWDVSGGDIYGNSPGMDALPALRELQMQAKRRNEAIDFMVKPETVTPPGLRLTREPGRTVSGSGITKEQVFVPYQMPYQAVEAIGGEADKCKLQIDGLSYSNLFNAITNMQGIQPRNVEEIASRNEEKLTQLGPVIERVNNEKLEVAIDRVFGIMMRGRLLPPMPEALSNVQIDVEFVSILSQMQRMVGIGQIERSVAFAGNLAGVKPEVLDNLDEDETWREYVSRAGAPAKITRNAREVAEIRAGRAKQQQMAQAAQMAAPMKDAVGAAQLLSETDAHGQSLLDRVMPT